MTIFSKSLKLLRLIRIEHLPSKQRVTGSSPVGVARTSTKSIYFDNIYLELRF